MRTSALKYLLVLSMLGPLLSGCWLDDDDDDDTNPTPPPVTDGGNGGGGDGGGDGGDGGGDGGDPDPSTSISSLFATPSDSEPVEITDAEALRADIEATFGASTDEPQEPDAVLTMNSGS